MVRKAIMSPSSLLFLLFYVTLTQVLGGELLLEEGYTVTTVIDGDKVKVNPHLILAQYGSSEFVLLDSSASTFYTVSFPSPQESVIKKLTGNGVAGYEDGDLDSAMFNNPNSFAVDFNGNIYVADKKDHTIRKISQSGVTTIAGGYTQKTGNKDGPSQNATFSDECELTFAPMQCALMISDHGNRLVRQINLKAEDCKRTSENVLGTTSAWVLALLFACLLSFAIGFVVRPYVFRQSGRAGTSPTQRDMEAFPNPTGETSSDVLLRHQKRSLAPQTSHQKPVSLLDSDQVSSHLPKSQMVAEQLRDLITFEEDRPISDDAGTPIVQVGADVSDGSNGKIDGMIQANILDFAEQAPKPSAAESSATGNLGLVRRRSK